jgi:3-oxo-5-alpha-steroid 4-dehydrogenase 1
MSCARTLILPTFALLEGKPLHDDPITGATSFDQLILIIFTALGVLSFLLLFFIVAPFGRFSENTRLPKIPGVIGWVLQESPAFFVFSIIFFTNLNTLMQGNKLRNILCAVMFLTHYFHRAFIYPNIRLHSVSPHSFYTVIFAFMFCTTNGYLNSKFLLYSHSYVNMYQLVIGCVIWTVGFYLNYMADETLINLRKNNKTREKKYHIPHGGLFEYVSAANYTSEMIEWFGFAIAVNHCAAWVFCFWTVANLLPRGISVHKWYHEKFPGKYPKSRAAVIPFIL